MAPATAPGASRAFSLTPFDEAIVAGQQRTPRIALVSHSAIADDPRVRRQGDAFAAAGWEVTAIGLDGASSPPPHWRVISVDAGPFMRAARIGAPALSVQRMRRLARLASGLALQTLGGPVDRLLADYYPALPGIAEAAQQVTADLWLANDWPVLPIARAPRRWAPRWPMTRTSLQSRNTRRALSGGSPVVA